MATMLAERIVSKLIASSAVKEADRELYVYGFFLLITRFFFFLISIAFGFFWKIPCESVIFYIVFFLLRSYAGGIHMKTEMACTAWTTLAFGVVIASIRIIEQSDWIIMPLLILSNLSVFLFSPLGSEEKPLDNDEHRRYRKICCRYLLVFNMVIIVSLILACPALYSPVLCGMGLESMLLCIGKMCNYV